MRTSWICPENGRTVNPRICDVCVNPCDDESARRTAEEIMDNYPAIGHRSVKL